MTPWDEVYEQYLRGWAYQFSAPDTAKKETNCVVFVEMALEHIYDLDFTREEHADLMVLSAERPFSPIDAIVSAGIGQDLGMNVDPLPGRWHLIQRWASVDPLKYGHSLLYYQMRPPLIEDCMILQAIKNPDDYFRAAEWSEAVRSGPYRIGVLNEV